MTTIESIQPVAQNGVDFAATKIQSLYRGYVVRRESRDRKYLLDFGLFERAKAYVNDPARRQNIPSIASTEPIFFPKELSVVLKMSGSPKNQRRFCAMKEARDICDALQCTHLAVPTARVYKNFIVESRLPVGMHDTKEQIGLYVEHVELFTPAIREFCLFLFHTQLDDITGDTDDPFQTLSSVPIGRYDNLPLYLEKQVAKIGLVDLEDFTAKCSHDDPQWALKRSLHLVRLFPLHFEHILDIAKRFAPEIEHDLKKLQKERDATLAYFHKAYFSHRAFVEESCKTAVVSPQRKEKLVETILDTIRLAPHDPALQDCMEEVSEKKLLQLKTSAALKIVNGVLDFMQTLLTRKMKSQGGHLLATRTLIFGNKTEQKLYAELKKTIGNRLNLDSLDIFALNILVEKIIDALFTELARGKEIASYHPSFGPFHKCLFC